MELFDYLNSLTLKKEELDFKNEEINKGYQPFLINRFVSMCDIFVPVVNEINKYDVPKDVHYSYMFSVIPKRKQFFKYIKKSKDLTEKEKELIAQYFEVGKKEAEEYINILDEKQLKEIISLYDHGITK